MPILRFARFAIVFVGLLVALSVGVSVPVLAASPATQSAPVEGSIFPALLQVALIVLLTEGLKSLARALGGVNTDGSPKIDLSGKAAAYAYIIVGVLVYAVQIFLLPNLPAGASAQLEQFLGALAIIIGGSGLYSMTSALRISKA